jgi:hypothetical protein
MLRIHRLTTAFIAATWLYTILIAGGPAVAQQRPVAELPSDLQLDALLAARSWNAIGAAIASAKGGEPLKHAMDWLQTRLAVGGGAFLGFLYAPRLWIVGNAIKVEDPDKDTRVTAAFIVLYTYELIAVDGTKCADRSAPNRRATQLLTQNGAALAYLKAKPDAVKAKLIQSAIALEKANAPRRKDDDFLCRDGMEQMQAGIAAGTTHDMTGQTNNVGRTIGVEAPIGWTPRMLPPATYQPMQERARSEMAAQLSKLLQ